MRQAGGVNDLALEMRPGGRFVTLLLVLLALPIMAVCGLQLMDIDGNKWTAALIALVPYFVIAGALLAVLALLLRRWGLGVAVVLVVAVLAAGVAPRAFAHSRPYGTGPRLRVLSVNLYLGRADAASVVALVRAHQADVLSLQELTPAVIDALDAAGIGAELPFRVLQPPNQSLGSGLLSRYPLRPLSLGARAAYQMPSASLTLPSGQQVEIVAVHVVAPVRPLGAQPWQRELAGLPEGGWSSPLRVLAGDFNATLDHAALRQLLNRGYKDAAAEVGQGLRATWPAAYWRWPPVTIDHVLVDRRCVVEQYQVLDVPGSDHHAVFAEFFLSDTTQ
jgi:endonuclease/exonuclease/phosphatase (EEP) superfamily protein YafD